MDASTFHSRRVRSIARESRTASIASLGRGQATGRSASSALRIGGTRSTSPLLPSRATRIRYTYAALSDSAIRLDARVLGDRIVGEGLRLDVSLTRAGKPLVAGAVRAQVVWPAHSV